VDWNILTRMEKEGRLPKLGASPLSVPAVVSRWVISSDQHGRFVDPQAWRSMLQFMDDHGPFDGFVFNGDMLDFYELSRYAKDPDKEMSIEVDLQAGRDMLTDIRNRHEGEIRWNPGNHEFRYELYLQSDAKRLTGLACLELPVLLDMERLGVEAGSKDGFELTPGFRVYHGEVVRKHAGQSALGEMEKWGQSGASGHVHRLAVLRQSNAGGERLWGEGGCLCSMSPEYMTHRPNWQHGFLVASILDDMTVVLDPVPIHRGHALWAPW
jgi:hypothetical protein